ncbi:anhydro-N-acetylmuramic acid kinase [Salegentibacter chungangensis]|uniref:Anhydro-N-acetylmuramic acid kinase n=1 Tax=Salegentibacter chungangensis TaxID=1335724 RepID=A0ABW3NW91_9FLAO
MKKSTYKVIGVMSGTSLDGIDLIYVEFDINTQWDYSIIAAETLEYTDAWRTKLAAALDFSDDELKGLNQEYTRYLAGVISTFIKKHNIKELDAVCSHGHTIKHEPENNYTLQIGNLPVLANLIGHKVVCDFRVQDVKLGGQGAPLVPIGDRILFSDYKYCLNLGGFANISTETASGRMAYDICAVNTVMNPYAKKLGKDYDKGGAIAATGKHNQKMLYELNNLDFYRKDPPKSLGIEWVNKEIFPLLKEFENDLPSVLRTYCEHIAMQVANAVDGKEDSRVLVTGGGAFNDFLIEQFREFSNVEFVIPSKELIDFKEALIFALLGVLKLRGEVNVLKSVTGASKDHSSGLIFNP